MGCRNSTGCDDESTASTQTAPSADAGAALLDLYDLAMPQIYGYFHRRCRNRATAEDLTPDVFLAAVDSISRSVVDEVTVAWLVGIARHKLVDHWRRLERKQRRLDAVGHESELTPAEDEWDVRLDALAAHDVLADLGEHHRSALTLRSVDDLSVREVAALIDRTEHATEALLVRARRAFRTRYEEVTR